MLNSEEIYELYKQRETALSPFHASAQLLQTVYEGKLEVPLPEIDDKEATAAANLVQIGLDQHAMRISSTAANLICPAMNSTQGAEKKSNQRRLAIQAWWYLNRMQTMMLPKRARHLAGLAMSPVLIRPGKDQFPVWEPRHPLETFPPPGNNLVPEDCIFRFERDAKWVRRKYPEFALGIGEYLKDDKKLTLLQYISSEQIALVVCGEENYNGVNAPVTMTLATLPNRAGRPLVIIPGRITLDGLQGQFDQLVGMYATQSKLWALQIHAVMREIFGETWAQATANGGTPVVETKANPYDNTIGIIRDGNIQQFRVMSSQGPNLAIANLERAQRLTGAIPAEMGGESPSNIRTGRRGGQVFSAAVDFYVAEHQNILAASLEEENKVAIAIAKGYWGDEPKTFMVPLAKGQVSYTPNRTFDTDANFVSYAWAGTDTNTLVVGGGQRVAQKTLSKTSFMAIDPMVTDVDAEHDKIIAESIEEAMLASILQQAAMPDGPWQPDQLGRLMELVYTQDMPLWRAVRTVHEEAQAAQEAATPEAPTQPGMAMAGAPGTPGAAIPPANASQVNLSTMLMNLRNPQRRINEGST